MSERKNPPFLIVDIEQGTDEWRTWRSGGIGGSDAPAIMGENRWKSAQALRRERQQPLPEKATSDRPQRMTPAMARGVQLEPEARQAYNTLKKIEVAPACLQSTRWEWMRCSLDGICFGTSTVVEIKCGHSAYKRTLSTHKVPRYYYGQVQHSMAVTGFLKMDFFCYLPGQRPVLLTCERDQRYIDRLVQRARIFWESLDQQ